MSSCFDSKTNEKHRELNTLNMFDYIINTEYTKYNMPRPDVDQLDEQINRLRGGGALTENEVKILCDKVSAMRGHRRSAAGMIRPFFCSCSSSLFVSQRWRYVASSSAIFSGERNFAGRIQRSASILPGDRLW